MQIDNTDLIKRAILEFKWDKVFSNTKTSEKVYIFSHTIFNILCNFTLHESEVTEIHHNSKP